MRRRRDGLLTTESKKEFTRRLQELSDYLKPTGALEKYYADDIAHSNWLADRYDRAEAGLWNRALIEALENLLKDLLPQDEYKTHFDLEQAASDFAHRYFHDSEIKAEVTELLRNFRLDETVIEAEAYRLRSAELEALNRMKAFQFGRRDKNVFMLAEIRQNACLQPNSDAGEDKVPQLIAVSNRSS